MECIVIGGLINNHKYLPSQYGFVFGVSYLTSIFAAPFFAVHSGRIGPRLVLILGTLLQTVPGGILFGLLSFVEGKGLFLGLSYLLRVLYGLGDAAAYSAKLAILISLFPDRVASVMAACETFYGLGFTIGIF